MLRDEKPNYQAKLPGPPAKMLKPAFMSILPAVSGVVVVSYCG
jgi:hypothetical protein